MHRAIKALWLALLLQSTLLLLPPTADALIEPRPGGGGNAGGSGSSSWWPGAGTPGSSSGSGAGGGDGDDGKGKAAWPRQGLSGGEPPTSPPCQQEGLPGCTACLRPGRCDACEYTRRGARFVLDPGGSGQCVCPPGYGLLPDGDGDNDGSRWGSSTELQAAAAPTLAVPAPASGNLSAAAVVAAATAMPTEAEALAEAYALGPTHASAGAIAGTNGSSSNGSSVGIGLAVPQAQQQPEGWGGAGSGTGGGNLWGGGSGGGGAPWWATACLPCPVNYYSPGGQVGRAACAPCPGSWTTGGAVASGSCGAAYCAAGQQPVKWQGTCQPCPFGTYSGSNANNAPCAKCPANTTTLSVGSTSVVDCKVRVCQPGQELDLDLLACRNCTGNTFSPGGAVSQGSFQPRCLPCTNGTSALVDTTPGSNRTRSTCVKGSCPPTDSYAIVCDTRALPGCGPGAKPISLRRVCQAFPPGAQLSWYPAANPYSGSTSSPLLSATKLDPPIVNCPAGANSTTTFIPAITSFNGLTNCPCTKSAAAGLASCVYTAGSTTRTVVAEVANPQINVTLNDPQQTAITNFLQAVAPTEWQNYSAAFGGYCAPVGSSVPAMAVTCSGPYVTSLCVGNCTAGETRSLAGLGTLPPASRLAGLAQLQSLSCISCNLNGSLPADWGTSNTLQRLLRLGLSPNNTFTGASSLPPQWGNLVNLQVFNLSSTASLGTIPSAWGNMQSLQLVNMTNTKFTDGSCAPSEWQTYNGLTINTTLFLPSTVSSFCDAGT